MKFKFLLFITIFLSLFIAADSVFAQTRNTTCSTRGPGRNCANEGTGLFWCGSTCRALPADPGDPRTLDCSSCTWGCPSGQIDCSGTCQAPSTATCAGGLTADRCTGACPAVQYVLRSPATAQDASVNISRYLKSSGSLDLRTVADEPGTSGDVYLNTGRAIRIDRSGNTGLNLGNYDSGAGAFHFTLRAGADSLADLILRKGDSDRWALAVEAGVGEADNDFEIRRFRTGAWTTLFSLDYDNGNIALLDGAMVDGVDLADVITQPATCLPDQVLQWSGTAWTCENQAAGGTTYGAGSNISINTVVTPNTIGIVSAPTFSGLTVNGGLAVTGNASFTGEQFEVGAISARSLYADGTIEGNFVATGGASCAATQILERSTTGWTCAALPAAGITAEADPTFAAWRGIDVGAQRLSGLTISGGLTIGANAVVSGDLRVNRNSTVDGALSALSVTATEDVSGRDLIASRDARVTGTGTFDGLVTVNDDLTISGGDINLDANREIQLAAPTNDVNNRLNINGATGAGGGVALRIISPGTENISEVLLRQGDTDRWALSTRDGSSNFEIWRNNGGWIPDLQIDYNTGRVTLQHSPLIVSSIQSSIGTLSIDSLLNVQSASDSGSNILNRPVRIGTNSLGLGPLRGDDALIEGNAFFDGLHSDDYLMRLNTFGEGAVTPRFTVNRAGNIVATGSITARGSVFSEGILRASAGAHLAGGTTTIFGGLTADTATMDSLTINTSATIRGRLNVDGGATVGTLTASSVTAPTVNISSTANVTGALDVGGTITAGSQNVQITSAGGGLKMANLANEDWASTLADETDLGWLTIAKNTSATCYVVCENHGLVCQFAYNITSTGLTEATCGVIRRALCMCGG